MRTRWPVVLLGAIAVALVAVPVAAKQIVLSKSSRRFDHAAHAAAVSAKGITQPKCGEACHEVNAAGAFRKTGKREHARCFEGCHGFKHKYTLDKGELTTSVGRTCFSCHGSKLKYRPSSLGKVNSRLETTYVAVFSHKKHTQTTATSGRQCEQCHGSFGARDPKTKGALSGGHKVCSACHERGAEPLMHSCDGCHFDKASDRGKAPVVKARGANKYATTGAFSHDRHARQDRVGTKGKECLACHSNIKDAPDDTTIPLPTMQGCYKSCHNGANAFDATGATCTRCHKGGRK